jgi:hypothetical protein
LTALVHAATSSGHLAVRQDSAEVLDEEAHDQDWYSRRLPRNHHPEVIAIRLAVGKTPSEVHTMKKLSIKTGIRAGCPEIIIQK